MGQTESTSTPLLKALKDKDLEQFRFFLSSAQRDEINKLHGFPHDSTCLQLAVERGLLDFVELLLDAKEMKNDYNGKRKLSAIHLAMTNKEPKILELLLKKGTNVNEQDGVGRTPLHMLFCRWAEEGFEGIRSSFFELLVKQKTINVNIKDNNGITPLELAVNQNLRREIEKLSTFVEVINPKVRQIMKEKMPDVLSKFPDAEEGAAAASSNPSGNNSEELESELVDALKKSDQIAFQTLVDQIRNGDEGRREILSQTTSNCKPTLLQQACQSQIPWAVSSLLIADVNPNQTSTKSTLPALMEAALSGNVEIVQMLVSHRDIRLDVVDQVDIGQTALHKITLKLLGLKSVAEKERYVQCLRILVSPHPSRGTPSINVNAQDAFGNTALHYATLSGVEDAELQLLKSGANLGIKNCLGETVVKRITPSTLETFLDSCIQAEDGGDVTSHNFSITFDYSLLAPDQSQSQSQSQAPTGTTSTNDENVTISLHNTQNEKEFFPECKVLCDLSTSKKHQYLLQHPLLTSFLMLKWHNICLYYYVNVLLYVLTVLFLSIYILLLHSSYEPEATWVWYALGSFIIILLIREVVQLLFAPLRYLRSFETYVELAIIGCTSTILTHWQNADPWRRPISALAILLAWVEVLLLLGRHPRLSIFVNMFTTVSLSFVRWLLCYSFLLIGFTLSFFIVFGSSVQVPADGKEKNGTAFSSIPVSLLKVLVMMSGELDYDALPFDENPFFSRIIFVAFLFLITIVLLNLLNGMAVSDTQSIQNKAEVLGFLSRVEFISYLELMYLGYSAKFSLLRLTRHLKPDCFMSPERVFLFHKKLVDKKFTAALPRRDISNQDSSIRRLYQGMITFRLDEDIFHSACQRLKDNRQRRSQQQDANA